MGGSIIKVVTVQVSPVPDPFLQFSIDILDDCMYTSSLSSSEAFGKAGGNFPPQTLPCVLSTAKVCPQTSSGACKCPRKEAHM